MEGVEIAPEAPSGLGVEGPVADRHPQVPRLADVAQVGRTLATEHAFGDAGRHPLEGLALEAIEAGRDLLGLHGVEPAAERGAMVDARHRRQQAERGEHAGVGRHDHRAEAELGRLAAGMQRARAAECEQVEARRVEAAADGHQPGRLGHRRVGDLDDRDGGLEGRDPESRPEARDGGLRSRDVQRQAATRQRCRADPAEDDVRVGHRRLGPAPAVARRTRVRAGALGPDAQDSARIDPGNEPPPAPISTRSTTEPRIGSPLACATPAPDPVDAPSSQPWIWRVSPRSIIPTLAVVPPMSRLTRSALPTSAA